MALVGKELMFLCCCSLVNMEQRALAGTANLVGDCRWVGGIHDHVHVSTGRG